MRVKINSSKDRHLLMLILLFYKCDKDQIIDMLEDCWDPKDGSKIYDILDDILPPGAVVDLWAESAWRSLRDCILLVKDRMYPKIIKELQNELDNYKV